MIWDDVMDDCASCPVSREFSAVPFRLKKIEGQIFESNIMQ